MIDGLAKPVGDEIWFSISGSNRRDSVKAEPLISGVRESQIVAYHLETKAFRTVLNTTKRELRLSILMRTEFIYSIQAEHSVALILKQESEL